MPERTDGTHELVLRGLFAWKGTSKSATSTFTLKCHRLALSTPNGTFAQLAPEMPDVTHELVLRAMFVGYVMKWKRTSKKAKTSSFAKRCHSLACNSHNGTLAPLVPNITVETNILSTDQCCHVPHEMEKVFQECDLHVYFEMPQTGTQYTQWHVCSVSARNA